ncbi:hypothetical protein EYF80_041079 [Liparis tanakae]|uniref:Uncharacterized protein n=1 Tax=Liparis tanakae TaxID=230148 RepID=A0A4Z2G633_9TELE|nr:hypothetical protein EYF80_041079 [Liparis tanakae]
MVNTDILRLLPLLYLMKPLIISSGSGKMMVEFFSAAMVLSVCRPDGDSAITSDASFSARDAFISPSAAITWRRTDKYDQLSFKKQKNGVKRYLGSGLAAGLGLGGHCSLELNGQLDVFDLHPLHLDAPVVRGVVQRGLRGREPHLGDSSSGRPVRGVQVAACEGKPRQSQQQQHKYSKHVHTTFS